MGKIFDALEKSEKENTKSDDIVLDNIENGSSDKIKEKTNLNFLFKPNNRNQKKIAPSLITLSQPQSFETEQFRSLKTNLMFSSEGKIPRIIMVTSAVPDEGKSFVAANLAVTFAQSVDEHVLLIDCDLRLPTVHKVFGLHDETLGLSDFLNGKIDIPDALHKTGINKLTVMPGGRVPNNPAELLSSIRMKNLLKEVEARYNDRYIIIDSPPPLLTAETIALSKQVDGIVIVIKHESTSRNDVKEMINLMDKTKIVGVVVNRYDVRLEKYYGYGKYGSYYVRK